MTRRLSGALISTFVVVACLVVIALAVAGCAGRDRAATERGSATSPARPQPPMFSHRSGTLAGTDPAVWAAVRFEQARCSWDWHQPLAAYLAAQHALATAQYGTQLAAQADPGSWRTEVVAGRQHVNCTVSAACRLLGAPSTSTRVYVRMSVTEQVRSRMGSFDGGQSIASWLVQLVAGRWLVAGTFSGG